ncbi:hypothetical protein KC364_g43 [Hortaea werneckii]|nr:hypothetical protein KC364_g43 [Hortaea werneckii]
MLLALEQKFHFEQEYFELDFVTSSIDVGAISMRLVYGRMRSHESSFQVLRAYRHKLRLENTLYLEGSLFKHCFWLAVPARLSFVVCHPTNGSYSVADRGLNPMEDADFFVHAPSEGRKAYEERASTSKKIGDWHKRSQVMC